MSIAEHLQDLEDEGYGVVIVDEEESIIHVNPEPSDWNDILLEFKKSAIDRRSRCGRYITRAYTSEQGKDIILEDYPHYEIN